MGKSIEEFLEFFATKKFRRVTLFLFLLGVSLIALSNYFVLNSYKENTLRETRETLQTIADSTRHGFKIWLKERKKIVSQIGSYAHLQAFTEEVLMKEPTKENLSKSLVTKKIREFFLAQKNFKGLGFFIIGKNRISYSSMRDTNLGSENLIHKQRADLLDRVFAGETFFIPPIESDVQISKKEKTLSDVDQNTEILKETTAIVPTMFIAAPITNKEGQVIAVLTQRLDPEEEFSKIIEIGSLKKTGETYSFDYWGRMLSNSRFTANNNGDILSLRVVDPVSNKITFVVRSALKKTSGVSQEPYRNYQGKKVLGAWFWDEKLKLGLASEIELSEVLEPFRLLQLTTWIIFIVTIFLLGILLFLVLVLGQKANKKLRETKNSLEETVEKLELFIKHAPVAIAMFDKKMNYLIVSNRFVLDYHLENKKVIGESHYDIFPNHSDEIKEVYKRCLSGEVLHGKEKKILSEDGSEEWENWVMRPWYTLDDEIEGVILFTQRVTEEKKIREALQQEKIEKEAEKKANEAKTEFINRVSHELRTPLNGIIVFTDLALELVNQEPCIQETKLSIYLKSSYDNGQRLLALVNDILDLAKLESGKMDFDFSVGQIESLLDSVLSEMDSLLKKKKISVESDFSLTDGFAYFDPVKLSQVFTNLFSNAIKFSPENSKIKVSFKDLKRENGDLLSVSVADEGPGIPEKDTIFIFEKFSQSSLNSSMKGTGLGLAICKEIVAGHSGSIFVENSEKGAVFTFIISKEPL